MYKQRRKFIQQAGIVAGVGSLNSVPVLGQNFDCYMERLPGAQLYTLREALAQNPDAALAQLAVTGIQEVELYGLNGEESIFGMPLLSFRALLEKHNLSMSYAHIDPDNIDVPAIAQAAKTLGIETVILPVAPGFMQTGAQGLRIQGPQSMGELDRVVDLLNTLGRQFRSQGLFFAYHNHHVEFQPLTGVIPYNYMMYNTDPQFVRCELDIGWMALAGVDYLDYLERFGNRTLSCHMKDFNGLRPSDMGNFLDAASHLSTPGSGVVNFTAVLEKMDYFGIRHGFVETDVSDRPLADIANGTLHLELIRQCA